MSSVVSELLATDAAVKKLSARSISLREAEQVIGNRHAVARNRRGVPDRQQFTRRLLLIGYSDGGRVLTLVIEATADPTTWLLITGWRSTEAERKILVKS